MTVPRGGGADVAGSAPSAVTPPSFAVLELPLSRDRGYRRRVPHLPNLSSSWRKGSGSKLDPVPPFGLGSLRIALVLGVPSCKTGRPLPIS